MSTYDQFCPLSKTMDLLGEPWTLLILRELLIGSSTFEELKRGLSKIPPDTLLARMQHLENLHIIIQAGKPDKPVYQLTPVGSSLGPAVVELAKWGAEHLLLQIPDSDLDVELLMLEIQRRFHREYLTEDNVCIHISLPEQGENQHWWLIADKHSVKLSRECLFVSADAHLICSLRLLVNIWLGNIKWEDAIKEHSLVITGDPNIVQSLPHWFGYSHFAPFNPRLNDRNVDNFAENISA